MPHLSEIVGSRGTYETFRSLVGFSSTTFSINEFRKLMYECGVDDPVEMVNSLLTSGLIYREGDLFGLTLIGLRTFLLLEAINGGDIQDIYRRLSKLYPSLQTYKLIREGMTRQFLQNLCDRPGFGRLYLCSPWISLDHDQEEMLGRAVLREKRKRGYYPEVLIITRPREGTDNILPDTLHLFRDIGASVFLNTRLHTKLYIREPGLNGGFSMAIIGSQNLTGSRYLELGIQINSDSQMINKLINYFLELTSFSQEA